MFGLNRDSAPNLILVKTALNKLVDQAQMENTNVLKAEATDAVIFTQDSASNAAVNTSVLGGGGYFSKRLDDVAPAKNAAISAAALRTTIVAEFQKDLPIPRTFMADQQQSAVSRAVNQQMKTWLASRDRNAMSAYSGGFATNTTIDGVYLFSNSHVNQNGDTVDNLETGVLNDTNMNIGVVSLRNQLSQTGVKLGYEPKFLLTSSLNHQNGLTVTKSVLRAGTGNNDLNYFSEMYPGLQVKFNVFLDDVSTTAYFIGTANHGVYRFEREAFFTDLTDWKMSASAGAGDNYRYLMRAREEVDTIEYSGLVGSTGLVS